jgi:hypothetical protein
VVWLFPTGFILSQQTRRKFLYSMANQHVTSPEARLTAEQSCKTRLHEIEQLVGGPTSGPNKLCWECGGRGHTRREHWRFYNRLRKETKEKGRAVENSGNNKNDLLYQIEQASKSLDSNGKIEPLENENLVEKTIVLQRGGDYVCKCEVFECTGFECQARIDKYERLFVFKNGCTEDLLRFSSCVNLGRKTIAGQKALVDCGASTNFMSKELYECIRATGSRGYTLAYGGWMQVTAAGWQSGREKRRRITIKVEIGSSYAQELEFTVFGGLKSTGYDLVLGKPWLRLHNKRHEIDYQTNEMWIDSDDGRRHHLVGLRPEAEEKAVRAKELGITTITWREAQNMRHRDKGVMFFMARAEKTR